MQKDNDMQNKKFTHIDHRHLTLDPTFRHRRVTENTTHLAALRKTLRNTGRLDAVLVWREQNKDGKHTGRLILLDGHFRVHAYRAETVEGRTDGKGIPAFIWEGTRIDAELAALSANVKDALPLTMGERTDAAWTLVRRHRNAISKAQLAKASGVSARTIANMRTKLREFTAKGEAPSGEWWRDRKWPEESDYNAPTDEERERIIAAVAASITEALREHRVRDIETKADAIERALGQRELKDMVEYLGLVEDDFDEFREEIHPEDLQDFQKEAH